MSNLSFLLSRAVARGRGGEGAPRNREQILVSLLRKRAEAHRHGLTEHEQRLRNQITWSLPIQDGEERTEAEPAEAA